MSVGRAIKEIRQKLGESQQAFSNRLRVTVTSVSRWETDRFTPEPLLLAQLAAMAREHGLAEAADALTSEAGVVFQIIGPKMLQHAWRQFEMISSAIIEFRYRVNGGGFGADIPPELWEPLANALKRADDGKAYLGEVMAVAPYAGGSSQAPR